MNNKKINTDKIELGMGDALLAIDIQNDFLPGGRLAVPDGDQVIPVMNAYIDRFIQRRLPVFATRDWHPKNHHSFLQQGGPWPEHCIAGSPGAEFAQGLHLPATVQVFSKGTGVENDGYSDFANPEMIKQLEKLNVSRLFIGGLATDYCVRATGADARALGFDLTVLTDAVRAVDVNPGDGDRALQELAAGGTGMTTTNEVLASMGSAE